MLNVAVARVDGSLLDDVGDSVPGWLGSSERCRRDTLTATKRGPFVASRALLRDLLQAATGVPAAAWDVSAEAGAAPLARAGGWAHAVHVSLSHRLGWVAAAVADAAVGVDIECRRPARGDSAERAALMLTTEELAEWQTQAAGARESALLARWTAKEAWYKASPPQSAPWDFRRVQARACAAADARANVRTWRAPPVQVALCCADARALAGVRCDGLPRVDGEHFWHVGAARAP